MRQFNIDEQNKVNHLLSFIDNVAFLEITATGLSKSIMDATENVRSFLKINNLHDYSIQGQGPQNKLIIPSFFITTNRLIKTEASLYRPVTKKGDPRIWFYNLKSLANPADILALFTFQGINICL